MQSIKANWPVYLYAILNLVGLCFHEVWRDEAQALLIAYTASSYWDLIGRAISYEGHPVLWYGLLRLVSMAGLHPESMQLLNSVLMISTVSIFWKNFPSTKLLRGFLIFNYFFFFEFGLISRCYGLGLFLFIFSVVYMDHKKLWLRNFAMGTFFLQTQNHALGIFVLGGVLLYRWSRDFSRHAQRVYREMAIIIFGICIALWEVYPPDDRFYATGWKLGFNGRHLWQSLTSIAQTFLYFPSFKHYPQLWQDFDSGPIVRVIQVSFFLGLSALFVKALYRRDFKLMLSFVVSLILLVTFLHVKLLYGFRHTSQVPILFLGFFILANKRRAWQLSVRGKALFLSVAILSSFAGLSLYLSDLRYPFSDAKSASRVLEGRKEMIIAWPDYTGTSLSAYMGARELFYVESMAMGSYIPWKKSRFQRKEPTLEDIESIVKGYGQKTFLFASYRKEFAAFFSQKFVTQLIYSSEHCMVYDECYTLLHVTLKP